MNMKIVKICSSINSITTTLYTFYCENNISYYFDNYLFDYIISECKLNENEFITYLKSKNVIITKHPQLPTYLFLFNNESVVQEIIDWVESRIIINKLIK